MERSSVSGTAVQLGGAKDTSSTTSILCSYRDGIQVITASGWKIWRDGVVSVKYDDRGDRVPRQLELLWIGMACYTLAAFSGGWRGAHSSSIVLSIAARQIVVQRR